MEQLFDAYGYSKQLDDPEHSRTRYKSEFGFMDVWIGRKRVTVGIYDPATKQMRYKRVYSLEQLEDWIMAD